MAAETDGCLFRLIGDFVCLTMVAPLGISASLFKAHRGACRQDLLERAVAILENCLIRPKRAALFRCDYHPTREGPPAVFGVHVRGMGLLGHNSSITLSNADSREVRRIGRIIDG